MATQTKGHHVVVDNSGDYWQRQVESILALSSKIIVLHGAGSFNGISTGDADQILKERLIPWTDAYLHRGNVTFIFDGDNDDPHYPDIGHIAGRLRDHYGSMVGFYAVQMLGWYKYRKELPDLRPLHSASGNEYSTVLFPDKTFPGDHDHFSQNERLCRSPKYEQWYVGACGQIASKQLADYSAKVGDSKGVHRAVIFKAPVSVEQDKKIRAKIKEIEERMAALENAGMRADDETIREVVSLRDRDSRLRESLTRRAAHPYGLLCKPDGEFIMKPEYGNLMIEIV